MSDTGTSDTDLPVRLTYVGCGKAKREIDGHPYHDKNQFHAADLYTSNYFRLKREYAERMSYSWSILSAKHGTLNPFVRCKPYDVQLTSSGFAGEGGPVFETVEDWAFDVAEETEASLNYFENCDAHPPIEQIVVLAGKAYVDPLREDLIEVAGWFDVEVQFPFDETSGIGDQMAWLKEHTDPSRSVGARYEYIFADELEDETDGQTQLNAFADTPIRADGGCNVQPGKHHGDDR